MAVDHIEVTLVYRQVYWLTDGAARMMDTWGHIGQFDKIIEVVDGRVASALVNIMDKG